MEELQGQVCKVRRRLNLQAFLVKLPWCLLVGLSLAVVAITLGKWFPVTDPTWIWNASWLGGAAVAGFLAAVTWSWLTRLDDLSAAIEVDHRYGLKERVSSSLALGPQECDTEAGRALISDAHARVRKIDVDDRFHVRPSRRSLLPVIPVVLAGAIIFFVDDADPTLANTAESPEQIAQQSKQRYAALRKQMRERRQRTKEKGLEMADDLLRKLESELDELAEKGTSDRKQALVKLNNLADEIKKRQDQLGDKNALKEKLARMKRLNDGPGEKLAQAMKQAKFDKALEQIQTLQEKLDQQNLTPEEREQLAEQLNGMRDQMQRAVDDFKKKQRDLQDQIDKAREAGAQQEANQLQQQLDEHNRQAPDMNRLEDLANKLGQCAECARNGNMDQARQALGDMADELQELQNEMAELEELEMAMDEIQQCKNGMCQGGGEGGGKDEQGDGDKQMAGMKPGRGNGKGDQPGEGLGAGRGRGDRPIAEDDTAAFDTQVRQKLGPGKAVVAGQADGPNAKSHVRDEIKAAYESDTAASADPLSGQRLPKGYRKFVEEYFDDLRTDGE
ncbi:MAG: hypothetical protein DWQ31_01085 [Planctomycetota bacterium]|nr:MAG: hypothetical protein DWQ31_01085 [Planctomycetota bacterium]